MRSCLVNPRKPFPLVRIAFIAALTLLLVGWTTCSAMVDFNSCEGSAPQPQITSLSPGAIPGDAASVLLTVNGTGFAPQSQIMWNGNALPTIDFDSIQFPESVQLLPFVSGTSKEKLLREADVLVALAREVPAERVGERPLLHLAVADGQRDDPGARLGDDLLDARAFARREERVAAPEVHRRLRDREALHGLQLGRRF